METSLLTTLAFAFGLGLLHALDADHIIAVSALASRRPSLRQSLLFCVRWALGHTVALLALGAVVLFLGASLPARFADTAERLVGAVLIALGGWVLWDLSRRRVHAHTHVHEGLPQHAHWHAHTSSATEHEGDQHRHEHSAVLVGIVHGAAGSAPVIALLPLAQSAPGWGFAYLLVFSLGVLVSMTLFGGLVGYFFERLTAVVPTLFTRARAAVGVGAIAFGAAILFA